ncbi:serine protease 1-like [Stomoxys calcitrans]|uniref:serine protease 1-like n=1 Tax=Stomoxys calcitrans TaxID=35570 RepID=UPI0027E2A38C|nr:serine protease 1-like [Stomoxys calcitrans]
MDIWRLLALAITFASSEVILARHHFVRPLSRIRNVGITNGHEAAEGQFPYQVGLAFSNSNLGWWCGGSLIGNAWILTAAHCTSGAFSGTAFLGSTKRINPKIVRTFSNSSIYQHPSYDSVYLQNDISLIKIPAVAFNTRIEKIKLPANSYSTYAGQRAFASGWGFTRDSDTFPSSKLLYACLDVIENSKCAKTYDKFNITKKILCTATGNGTSICNRDGGGPLVLVNRKILIGVASFIHTSGCQSGTSAGFMRVTEYLDWIKNISRISY